MPTPDQLFCLKSLHPGLNLGIMLRRTKGEYTTGGLLSTRAAPNLAPAARSWILFAQKHDGVSTGIDGINRLGCSDRGWVAAWANQRNHGRSLVGRNERHFVAPCRGNRAWGGRRLYRCLGLLGPAFGRRGRGGARTSALGALRPGWRRAISGFGQSAEKIGDSPLRAQRIIDSKGLIRSALGTVPIFSQPLVRRPGKRVQGSTTERFAVTKLLVIAQRWRNRLAGPQSGGLGRRVRSDCSRFRRSLGAASRPLAQSALDAVDADSKRRFNSPGDSHPAAIDERRLFVGRGVESTQNALDGPAGYFFIVQWYGDTSSCCLSTRWPREDGMTDGEIER